MMNQPSVIHSDADIMGGTPVFRGTRVPFQTLMDYLEAGHPLENFLDDFPTVSRVQAIAALEEAKDAVLAHALAAWIECLPKKLKRGLAGHEVKTVPECGDDWHRKTLYSAVFHIAYSFTKRFSHDNHRHPKPYDSNTR